MRLLGRLTALALAGVIVWALATLPPPRQDTAAAPADSGTTTVAGAFHIHTRRSDGSGTPDEVAAAAGRASLAFIILTDHGDGTRQPDPPTYRSGVLVLDGVEISTSGGHYAVLDLPAVAPYPLGGEARDVVADVRRLGAFGVVTHPGSPKPALRWQDWSLPVDAIEWLNADSEWRDEGWMTLARGLLQYFVRPVETLASLLDRPGPVLADWDDLIATRQVVALAGVDAHARIRLGLGGDDGYASAPHIAVPTYERSFRGFSLRVALDRPLSGDAAHDGADLLAAIRAGRVYTVIDGFAAAPVVEFGARQGQTRVGMGGRLAPAGETPIVFELSLDGQEDTDIVLLRNGVAAATAQGRSLTYTAGAEPAAYRAEVYLPQTTPALPWILTNPIYVGPPPAADEPGPTEAATRVVPIDVATAWAVERDEASAAVLEIAGPAGDELGITYTLGSPRNGSPYVAVSHAWPQDAAAGEAFAFVGRADRPLRLSVQLRAAASPESHRWRRSVYLDPEPALVRVRFDELRPVGRSPERPDLARVDAILLVADTSNAVPGSTASVWLSEVRVEEF